MQIMCTSRGKLLARPILTNTLCLRIALNRTYQSVTITPQPHPCVIAPRAMSMESLETPIGHPTNPKRPMLSSETSLKLQTIPQDWLLKTRLSHSSSQERPINLERKMKQTVWCQDTLRRACRKKPISKLCGKRPTQSTASAR